jgi:hypothetical protein
MKRILTALLVIAGFGITSSSLAQDHLFSKSLEVTGTLMDVGSFGPNTPKCGGQSIAVSMKYNNLKIISGNYPAKVLHAIHICPQEVARMNRPDTPTFRKGEVHHLKLRLINKYDAREQEFVHNSGCTINPLYTEACYEVKQARKQTPSK